MATESTKYYTAKGLVYGYLWGSGQGSYPSTTLHAATLEELREKAHDHLKTGKLDSGMGFESLIGALFDVTETETIKIDEKEFEHKEFSFLLIGELTEDQQDHLWQHIDYI